MVQNALHEPRNSNCQVLSQHPCEMLGCLDNFSIVCLWIAVGSQNLKVSLQDLYLCSLNLLEVNSFHCSRMIANMWGTEDRSSRKSERPEHVLWQLSREESFFQRARGMLGQLGRNAKVKKMEKESFAEVRPERKQKRKQSKPNEQKHQPNKHKSQERKKGETNRAAKPLISW